MYTTVQKNDLPASLVFRYCGRAGGVFVLTSWILMVVAEFFRSGAPVIDNYYQAVVLGVIFIGYAAGWRYEVLGAALVIAGTLGFIVLDLVLFDMARSSGSEWFAAPGVFYLIAHYLDNLRDKPISSQQ